MKNLINTRNLFLMLVFSLPFFEFPVIRIGFNIRLPYIFALFTLFAFVADLIKNRQLKNISLPLKYPLFIFLFIVLFSIFQSRLIPPGTKFMSHAGVAFLVHQPYFRSIAQFLALLFMVIPFYLTINLVNTKEMLYRLVYVWMIANTMVCLYGLYGFFGYQWHLPFAGFANMIGQDYYYICSRIKSVGGEPLFLGISLAVILPLGASLALLEKKRSLFILIAIQLLTIIFTFSRATWLTVIISFFIMGFLFKDFILKNIGKFIIAILILLLITELVFNFLYHYSGLLYLFDRFSTIFSGKGYYSNLIRIDTWTTAWRMFLVHPILGVGIGNFWFHYYEYSPLLIGEWWIRGGGIPPTVNNIFLSFLAETGILGCVALIRFLWLLFWKFIKPILSIKEFSWQAISFGTLAGFVTLLIGYQVFSTFYFTYVWVFFGLAIAVNKIAIANRK